MTYQEALQFIYEKLPMYHKIGSEAYKPGLQNIIELCNRLGNPQNKYNTIHITGTNGKGSTSHMMSALLQTANYKVGLFTSPHLKHFEERIKVNGQNADFEYVTNFINRNQTLIIELKPSFFEITTAMAFEYFAIQKVDIAVIEVGLGGRLDATNIIKPILSIITNISWDHMDLLGNTLQAIASEKAGIIKKNTPVVISETQDEVKQIFIDKAKSENSSIYFTDDIEITDLKLEENYRIINVKVNNEALITNVKCGLQGKYQLKNIKGVFKSWQLLNLQGVIISKENLIEALLKVKEITNFKGRWQKLNEKPLIICDTAHNESGITEIVHQINSVKCEKLFIVLGMVKEKEHEKILSIMPKNAFYIFTQPRIERAISASELAFKASKFGLEGEIINDVNDAIMVAKSKSTANDFIFIGGSTFVVAEIADL